MGHADVTAAWCTYLERAGRLIEAICNLLPLIRFMLVEPTGAGFESPFLVCGAIGNHRGDLFMIAAHPKYIGLVDPFKRSIAVDAAIDEITEEHQRVRGGIMLQSRQLLFEQMEGAMDIACYKHPAEVRPVDMGKSGLK